MTDAPTVTCRSNRGPGRHWPGRFVTVVATAGLTLLAACGSDSADAPSSAPGAGLTGIRYLADSGDPGDEFARALAPRRFEFPRDHGAHPEYRTEWWYFTGNVLAESGTHFGFELTVFRLALAAGPSARPVATGDSSAFAASQVWMGNLAVTDTRRGRFQSAERLSRGATGLAGASRNGETVAIAVEDWAISFDGPTVAIAAGDDGFGIDLELAGLDRIVMQGDAGLDPKGPEPGNASYYYSAPRLRASGHIRSAGEEPVAVEGTAWMDREWGTSALSADVEGWDWFALQLDDGRDLMFYRLRERDGGTSPYSGGSLIDAAGTMTRLGAGDVDLTVARHWTSSVTGVRYPVAWRLAVPAQDLDLDVTPRLDAQELDLTVRYWEGAVAVAGTAAGAAITGVGYLELAGY